jgi:hypothetical protein
MSEESRLGREAIETGYVLKQILDAGVRVFHYLSVIQTRNTYFDLYLVPMEPTQPSHPGGALK